MSIKYSLNQMSIRPFDPDCTEKNYYARAQADGYLGIEKICHNIACAGTAIRGDVLAVSDGLIYEMTQGLTDGKIVQLGDFGSFQIQLSSSGAETIKEFTSANIRKARIQFRPGRMLVDMLKTLSYERVEQKSTTRSADENGNGSGNDNDGSGKDNDDDSGMLG